MEHHPDPPFLDVLLGADLNTRLRLMLLRASQTEHLQDLSFKTAMSNRSALEARLLKVAGLGLKSAREVLEVANAITKDFSSQHGTLLSQIPLDVSPTSLEETTSFFDAFRWQQVSVRLRNVLTAAEQSCSGPRTVADFLENRTDFRNHVLRQSNIGKKTEEELLDLINQLLGTLRDGASQRASGVLVSYRASASTPDPKIADCEVRSLEDIVKALLLELRPRDADIIRRREGMGGQPKATLEELGQEYDLTRERIRQIEQKAYRRLVLAATSGNLKAKLQHHATALWGLISDGTGVLLVDDLYDALKRISSEARFAIELAWGSIDAWLTATKHAISVAWMEDADSEPLLTTLTQRLRLGANDRPLPFTSSSLNLSVCEAQMLAPACRLAGLLLDGGYICSGRLRGRKLRAVRLHAMLSERSGDVLSVGTMVERYRKRFVDDPCSFRDALIVMGDAPHLFIDILDDQWSSLAEETSASAEGILAKTEDNSVGEPEPGPSFDQSIVSVIERILERDGPLRFSDLRARAMVKLQDGQSRSSIGPVIITSGRFGRVAPGLYGLPKQLREVAQGSLFPDALLATDQCRWFVTGLHAGCRHGDFPAWTPLFEMRLCEWAESAEIDSALFDSLLAVVEPKGWPGSKGDSQYWSRLKSTRGHYWLDEATPQLLESPPPLDRLLAAAIDARRRGGANWISVNRVWSKRVDHVGAASLLALMVAARVLRPSDHWQHHHALGPDLERVIRQLTAHRMSHGTLHWDDVVGRQVGTDCRKTIELGWILKAELLRLVDTVAIADEPALDSETSLPADDLEHQLKQLRLRRQAALVQSLMQDEGGLQ